jgi:hypothetical protein
MTSDELIHKVLEGLAERTDMHPPDEVGISGGDWGDSIRLEHEHYRENRPPLVAIAVAMEIVLGKENFRGLEWQPSEACLEILTTINSE